MEEVRVGLGERSYDIAIGQDMLDGLGDRLQPFGFSQISVISNPTVYGLYGERLLSALKKSGFKVSTVLIPDGEGYKELLWAYYIYGQLLSRRLDRKSALIALGGGVIGDITGFVASTYMRGIAFIQVPTTLLAQVDSSVGGKTGVNHHLGKNMIGTFYQPRLVWADVATLRTLGQREFLAGMAEVIKYGVIWDEAFFTFVTDKRERILAMDGDALGHVIKRSCEIKAEVVSRDEREEGIRAILNYGHTIGHAIENATGYAQYLHGEAIAIGMHHEARLSKLLGHMKGHDVSRIDGLISSYGLPTGITEDLGRDRILSSMRLDKKAVAGELVFILPEKIGRVRIERVTDIGRIEEAIRG